MIFFLALSGPNNSNHNPRVKVRAQKARRDDISSYGISLTRRLTIGGSYFYTTVSANKFPVLVIPLGREGQRTCTVRAPYAPPRSTNDLPIAAFGNSSVWGGRK